jgi:prepilin-type N-terminal cleavage/methylation domain-containing protein
MERLGGFKYCMKKLTINQRGFTLIEIIAVLVILGVIAATAIPKYLDMGRDAIIKAAGAAILELNTRERMKLVEWKLKDGQGPYPAPGATATVKNGSTVVGPDTILGNDWNSNIAILSGQTIIFKGKQVTFTRNAPSDQSDEPWFWTVSVDG